MTLDKASLGQRTSYRLLVATAAVRGRFPRGMWDWLWPRQTSRMSGWCEIRVHGESIRVNAGYAYPAFARRWPTYNDPLVQIVHSTARARGRQVRVVDVGAAVGDTVLLVDDRAAAHVAGYLCFEPDGEFFDYLSHNLGQRKDVRLFDDMLSDEPSSVASLVRTHAGTASAQGTGTVMATTLDEALVGESQIDVLKVDTDGFDGAVLGGATSRLAADRPTVIFEWHPLLAERTGQDWHRPFEVLSSSGYAIFVWFEKEGAYSHSMEGYDVAEVNRTASSCLEGTGPRPDWHYDIVALPAGSDTMAAEIAGLADARGARDHS